MCHTHTRSATHNIIVSCVSNSMTTYSSLESGPCFSYSVRKGKSSEVLSFQNLHLNLVENGYSVVLWTSSSTSTLTLPVPTKTGRRIHGVHCCSTAPKYNKKDPATDNREAPQILKLAVSGVTELLRLFSPSDQERDIEKQTAEFPVSSVDDVLMIIKSDYENAYFVTGNFTYAIYAEDCIFEDPTIKFRGKELYERNLKLLVPFFECASIRLQKIEKDMNSDSNIVLATWKLRTNLKLPWRPLISIDGSTIYELDKEFKIVRHAESWNVSALEAIGQIFTFKFGSSGG